MRVWRRCQTCLLCPDSAHAHHSLGAAYLWTGELDRAIGELERATALDPNFAPSFVNLATGKHYAGYSQEALTHLATARRLDPYRLNIILHYEAQCHFMLGDYQRAAEVLRDPIDHFPETDISRALLASAYGHLGKMDEARTT